MLPSMLSTTLSRETPTTPPKKKKSPAMHQLTCPGSTNAPPRHACMHGAALFVSLSLSLPLWLFPCTAAATATATPTHWGHRCRPTPSLSLPQAPSPPPQDLPIILLYLQRAVVDRQPVFFSTSATKIPLLGVFFSAFYFFLSFTGLLRIIPP